MAKIRNKRNNISLLAAGRSLNRICDYDARLKQLQGGNALRIRELATANDRVIHRAKLPFCCIKRRLAFSVSRHKHSFMSGR